MNCNSAAWKLLYSLCGLDEADRLDECRVARNSRLIRARRSRRHRMTSTPPPLNDPGPEQGDNRRCECVLRLDPVTFSAARSGPLADISRACALPANNATAIPALLWLLSLKKSSLRQTPGDFSSDNDCCKLPNTFTCSNWGAAFIRCKTKTQAFGAMCAQKLS